MQTELEMTLAKLVAIPSVADNTDACHAVLNFVRSELEPLGLHITNATDQPNPWLVATTRETKTPDILLAAHLDVVPAPPESFSLQRHEGNLYGRGVYDMKFAAACYITFAKTHADILHTLDIGFLFTTDEEVGGDASLPAFFDMGWRPKRVLLPDGGDPWHIEKRAKGFFGVKINVTGKTAHGSRPWEGENALHTLMDIAHNLRKEYPPQGPNDATLAFTVLHSGSAINQISDHATATLDFRTFDKQELAIFKQKMIDLCTAANVTVTIVQQGAPVSFNDHTPEVQDFLKALRDITGSEPSYCDSFGGSDARYFASHDIPTIIIEPEGGGRHAPDEWILASDPEKYYRLIEHWLIPTE